MSLWNGLIAYIKTSSLCSVQHKDNVTTTGRSLIQMKQKLMELGAKSVMRVFMARTADEQSED